MGDLVSTLYHKYNDRSFDLWYSDIIIEKKAYFSIHVTPEREQR